MKGKTMTDRIPTPLDFGGLSFQTQKTLALARELLGSDHTARDTRASRTLAKSEALTVVLTVIRAGGHIDEHSAASATVIVPLLGTALFKMQAADPELQSVSVGEVLYMGSRQRHQVSAKEDCAFLIIIGSQL
jgi:quercetin dioxygenase-like cupin family protein